MLWLVQQDLNEQIGSTLTGGEIPILLCESSCFKTTGYGYFSKFKDTDKSQILYVSLRIYTSFTIAASYGLLNPRIR